MNKDVKITRIELTEDIQVRNWIIPAGFTSDGCTFPGPLRFFKAFMKTDKYYLGCVLHDFLRRYAIVSVPEADAELKRYIRDDMGDHFRAQIYWLFVKFSRSFFTKTIELPKQWEKYRKPVTGEPT